MQKRWFKTLSMLLIMTLLLGLLAACGGSNTTTAATTTKAGAGTTAATTTKAVSTGPKTFIASGPNNITQWDPLNENKTNATMLNRLHYNTLVGISTDLKTYQPELATKWEVSTDGLAWTFTLRNDVKWHDGDAFDADDVVATFQRMIDKPTLVQSAFWTLLTSVEKKDQYTVVLKLKQAWGAILSQLEATSIIPSHKQKELGDKAYDYNATNKPIGTGPWVCDSWAPGQDAVWKRNDAYWGWGSDKSNVDKIIYRPIIEDTTRVSAIQTGDITMAINIPVDQTAMLEKASGVKVEKILGTGIVHLGFRTVDSVFSDVNARQAISIATDRKLLVESVAGGGKASSWPCPENVIGFDATSPVPEYNVANAKALLAKTNYDGKEISFIVPTGVFARSKEVAQALTSMWTEAGFKVKLEIMENAAFQERRAAAKYDVYLQGYPFPAGDPDSVITQRWLNDAHKSGYKNTEMNDLILKSKAESDPTKRAEILKQVFKIEWSVLAPHMSLYTQINVVATRNNVSGVKYRPDSIFDYSRVKMS
jgi:ABC-type transport system substrate-binding protein